MTAGRFREALETVAPLLGGGAAGDAAAGPLVAETVVLALAYAGDGEAARSRLAELASSGRLDEARSGYLAGLVAQLAGEDGVALEAYRRSYELAARAADVHTVAAVTLNLGGLLADRGLYTEALVASERAVRELGRLGAPELATALVNAANLFVQLGDLPAARRALERARSHASDRQVTLAFAPAAFVEGERRGAPATPWRRSPRIAPRRRRSPKAASRTSRRGRCSPRSRPCRGGARRGGAGRAGRRRRTAPQAP